MQIIECGRKLTAKPGLDSRGIWRRAALLSLLVVLLMLLARPAFAHPPEIVRITDYGSSGRRVSVRGQVAYTEEPDGAYFVVWNFGDGSAPVVVINSEQDAQGYTPWQSHMYPKRNGTRWYTLGLWGYDHHDTYDGRSDTLTVVVTCFFGICRSAFVPPTCQLCPAPADLDLPTNGDPVLDRTSGTQFHAEDTREADSQGGNPGVEKNYAEAYGEPLSEKPGQILQLGDELPSAGLSGGRR